MGATLRYAKVIDREEYQRLGAETRPNLESVVHLKGQAPSPAMDFYVLRSYSDEFDAFTETWRILDPHGMTVREPVQREVLSGQGEIADEIVDQHFEYGDSGFQLVLEIDGIEVARAEFEVREPDEDPDRLG
jgi:hypothetical protein